MQALGERIKAYEQVTRNFLCKRMPVMVRVDGRAFHTLTCGADKPFDQHLINVMAESALAVAEDMQGFKAAYVQSDEATFFMTDYDDINTDGWFGYNLNKIVSLSASIMTAMFNANYEKSNRMAFFDSRAFNIPRDEVANAFLWRMKDWERNSLQMYCQSMFSHKQLYGKCKEDMHNMLHGAGKNWTTDLTDQEKNGTWIVKTDLGIARRFDVLPNYKDVAAIIDPLIFKTK